MSGANTVKKTWEISSGITEKAQKLSNDLGVSLLVAQLLVNRGIDDLQEANAFLNPRLEEIHDPFLLNDMQKAVDRIVTAINNEERVLIYGDYDVDGITASSLMIRVLKDFFPQRLLYYIPKRLEEGYGLHQASLEKAIAKGIRLVITVDCGITAVKEAEYLQSEGVDLIVTDHHEPQAELPSALAIIDPKREDSVYPFDGLAGVGVAFKLLQALATVYPNLKSTLYDNLDIVAFGTVADIVPLFDENRIIVKYGLERLKQTDNVGLLALIETSGLKGKEITAGHIGYLLAPRINAAGRMGNSGVAVRLFLTSDMSKALQYAKELEQENINRQAVELGVLQEAQAQIEADESWKNQSALVLAGENWHLGVVGIVASRLVEIYHKPVILLGVDDTGECRGSGRSISGFNLFEAIDSCSTYLERFGGHEFAAGLSLKKADFPLFKEEFLNYANKNISEADLRPTLRIESLIDLPMADLNLVQELSRLAPYGAGNPTPLLGCQSVDLIDCRGVGENGKHLKIRVSLGEAIRDAIGFNLGRKLEEIQDFPEIDLAFTLEENVWNGSTTVQLNLKDLRISGEEIKQVS